MGMDFVAIIENKYSISDMLNIPSMIDKHEILKELYNERHKHEIRINPNNLNKKSVWGFSITKPHTILLHTIYVKVSF